MKVAFIALCLVATVVAQRPGWFNNLVNGLNKEDDTIDRYHDFRFEYHAPNNGAHLLMAISDKRDHSECHVVEIDPSWEPLLKDDAKVAQIAEEMYHQMHANHNGGHSNEAALTVQEMYAKYHDNEATRECFRHKVFVLQYTPSAAVTGH